ncbi:MAG: hypothetical protein ABIQ01_08815 [Pseudolysinimonas sp.]
MWWDDITLTEAAWTEHPVASTVQDAMVRSQSGRIVANTLTALLVSLSGCVPVANISAHISAKGALEFGVCDAYELDAIEVSVVDRDTHKAEIVWRVEGDIQIQDDSTVSLGQLPAGSEEAIELADFNLSQNYVDFILISHRDGQVVSSYGHFDGAEILVDRWLTNSGGYRDSAC